MGLVASSSEGQRRGWKSPPLDSLSYTSPVYTRCGSHSFLISTLSSPYSNY